MARDLMANLGVTDLQIVTNKAATRWCVYHLAWGSARWSKKRTIAPKSTESFHLFLPFPSRFSIVMLRGAYQQPFLCCDHECVTVGGIWSILSCVSAASEILSSHKTSASSGRNGSKADSTWIVSDISCNMENGLQGCHISSTSIPSHLGWQHWILKVLLNCLELNGEVLCEELLQLQWSFHQTSGDQVFTAIHPWWPCDWIGSMRWTPCRGTIRLQRRCVVLPAPWGLEIWCSTQQSQRATPSVVNPPGCCVDLDSKIILTFLVDHESRLLVVLQMGANKAVTQRDEFGDHICWWSEVWCLTTSGCPQGYR